MKKKLSYAQLFVFLEDLKQAKFISLEKQTTLNRKHFDICVRENLSKAKKTHHIHKAQRCSDFKLHYYVNTLTLSDAYSRVA
ncbi:MAG: hypothetical protein K2Q14_08075 [Gammaproteobacteria bacterium]|nr:hypothetical protein [Gammaproteobacteria bacterium]